jgi:hypothetical protein
MNLEKYISNLRNDNLLIEHNADTQSIYNYIVRSKSNKIVAIGWKTSETESSSSIDFERVKNIIDLISTTEKELLQADFIVFKVSDDKLWAINKRSVFYPEMLEIESFYKLFELIIKTFPEVKPENEKKIDKLTSEYYLNNLHLENPNLGLEYISEEIKKLKRDNIHLTESENYLSIKVECLEEGLKKSEKLIDELNEKQNNLNKYIEIEKRTFAYLSILIKENVLEKLSKKQSISLINFIRNNKSRVEVNLDLMFPDLIIKTKEEKLVAYDTATDWIPFPTMKYRIIKKNGQIEDISINDVFENKSAVIVPSNDYFLGGIKEIDDLKGCIYISIEDIENNLNKTK